MNDPSNNPTFQKMIDELGEIIEEALGNREDDLDKIKQDILDATGLKVMIVIGYTWEKSEKAEKKNVKSTISKKKIVFNKKFTTQDVSLAHKLGIKIEPEDIENRTTPGEDGVGEELLKEALLKLVPKLSIGRRGRMAVLINSDPTLMNAGIRFNKEGTDLVDDSTFTKEVVRLIGLAGQDKESFISIKIIIFILLTEHGIKPEDL